MNSYDADEEFENYLCFSAMLAQRNETAIDTLEQIDEDDTPEYVNEVVAAALNPLRNLMEHKIRKYPYTPENLEHIVSVCGGKEAAKTFLENQIALQQDYYALLPLIKPKEEAEKEWKEVDRLFTEQKRRLDGING